MPPIITVRVEPDQLQRVDLMAARAGLTRSDYMRVALGLADATATLHTLIHDPDVADEQRALRERVEADAEQLIGVLCRRPAAVEG